MKQTIKRHLISFSVTFLAMFCLLIYPSVELGNWESSILISAAIAASRSAFKFAWEAFLVPMFNLILQWSKNYINK